MRDCNITANICVTTYHAQCVVNLLFVVQNGLSRNGLIEPIAPHLFRENSNIYFHVPTCTFNRVHHVPILELSVKGY